MGLRRSSNVFLQFSLVFSHVETERKSFPEDRTAKGIGSRSSSGYNVQLTFFYNLQVQRPNQSRHAAYIHDGIEVGGGNRSLHGVPVHDGVTLPGLLAFSSSFFFYVNGEEPKTKNK